MTDPQDVEPLLEELRSLLASLDSLLDKLDAYVDRSQRRRLAPEGDPPIW